MRWFRKNISAGLAHGGIDKQAIHPANGSRSLTMWNTLNMLVSHGEISPFFFSLQYASITFIRDNKAPPSMLITLPGFSSPTHFKSRLWSCPTFASAFSLGPHCWQDKVQHLYLGICKIGPNLLLRGHFLPFSLCGLYSKHSTFSIPILHRTPTARALDLCTRTLQFTNSSLLSHRDSPTPPQKNADSEVWSGA